MDTEREVGGAGTFAAIVEMDGHILDSLLLPKVLDLIVGSGAEYQIEDIRIGKTRHDPSFARVRIEASVSRSLAELVEKISHLGAKQV